MKKRGEFSIDNFFLDARLVINKIAISEQKKIKEIVNILFSARKNGNSVFLIGNGGSASTATHFAADLVKTVVDVPEKSGFKAISLVDNIPLYTALVNDWGKESIFVYQLRSLLKPEDVLVAFSVHGGSGSDLDGAWSQNITAAIKYAKDNGGRTIGFAGFDGGAMKTLCDVCVVVPANSTPIVESLHVLLAHGVTFCLKEMIGGAR